MIEEMNHDDPATRSLSEVTFHHPHQQEQRDNSRIPALLFSIEPASITLPDKPAELIVPTTPLRLAFLEQQDEDNDEEQGWDYRLGR